MPRTLLGRRTVFLVVAAAVAVVLLGACGGDEGGGGAWCRRITRSDAAFDTTDPFDEEAGRAFRSLARDAPSEVAGDLLKIQDFVDTFIADPAQAEAAGAEVALARWVETGRAINRVDSYLISTCGASVPFAKPARDLPER